MAPDLAAALDALTAAHEAYEAAVDPSAALVAGAHLHAATGLVVRLWRAQRSEVSRGEAAA